MRWHRLLLTIFELCLAGSACAQPAQLVGKNWFSDRGYDNTNANGFTAVMVRITEFDTDFKMAKGLMWVYEPSATVNNRYVRKDANNFPADGIRFVALPQRTGTGSNRTWKAKLFVAGREIGFMNVVKNKRAGSQRRIALRLKPNLETILSGGRDVQADKQPFEPCDEPPDDDILEEEDPPGNLDDPPTTPLDQDRDPYP